MKAPVIQLSINALKPLDYHVELGARLAPLRRRGVMIVASGNIVHNLRRLQWDRPDAVFGWSERFDEAVARQLADSPGDILRVADHPDYRMAVPTPDHFIPLLYLAGLATQQHTGLTPVLRGFAMGSISMTCYGLDADVRRHGVDHGAPTLPKGVPADQTNI